MSAQPRPLILLTRPEAQSRRFARALGRDCVISPLIAPVFLRPTLQGPYRAVILTSETGAQAAAGLDVPRRAFCVGDRTAEVARDLGFDATSARGDAEALVALILSAPVYPLIHLRGREARGDIAARLTEAGVPTHEAVVYAQEEQDLTPEALQAIRGQAPVIVPLFSPRTAEILAGHVARIGLHAPLYVVAMSQAVAWAARSLDPAPRIAARPDGDSMLEAVIAALETSPSA